MIKLICSAAIVASAALAGYTYNDWSSSLTNRAASEWSALTALVLYDPEAESRACILATPIITAECLDHVARWGARDGQRRVAAEILRFGAEHLRTPTGEPLADAFGAGIADTLDLYADSM